MNASSPRRVEPLRGRRALRWLLALLVLGAMGAAVYAARAPLLRALALWWVVDEPLVKSQAMVVLGGDSYGGDRVRHAAALYRQGWAPLIVLSGTSLRPYFNETEWMERDALDSGVPREALLLAQHNARSTLAEAYMLRRFLAEHNLRRIIVVTSNFHTRRARAIARAVLVPGGIELRVSAAQDQGFDPYRWWRQRSGLKNMGFELMRSIYTWRELRRLPPAGAEGREALGQLPSAEF